MRTIVSTVFSILAGNLLACCGISADISYHAISENAYAINVVTYTCLSAPSDSPEIMVRVDEEDEIAVPRVDIIDVPSMDMRISRFSFEHQFLFNGMHTVQASVGGRGAGMINILNSITEPLCIEAMFAVGAETASNTSPMFSVPPFMVGVSGTEYTHSPEPLDMDSDSLVLSVVAPNGSGCGPIAGYQFPTTWNTFEFNSSNGAFEWAEPFANGHFNITLQCAEFRNGALIGRVTRDMSLCVAGLGSGLAPTPNTQALTLWPTRTYGIINLVAPQDPHGVLLVVDGMGRVVEWTKVGASLTTLDITALSSGAYRIIVPTRNGSLFVGSVVKD